jgi:hypothetical protein
MGDVLTIAADQGIITEEIRAGRGRGSSRGDCAGRGDLVAWTAWTKWWSSTRRRSP